MRLVKNKIFLGIFLLSLVLISFFIFNHFLKIDNTKTNEFDLNVNEMNKSKFLSDSTPEPKTDLPICVQLPVSEVSLLSFTTKSKFNSTDIEFAASYENIKLPPLNTLFNALKNMLTLVCDEQTYPMKDKLVLPPQIWNQIEGVKPINYTYYLGKKTEYYSIGFNLTSERDAFQTKLECLNQSAFIVGDEIVFSGVKFLNAIQKIEGQAKIKCVGQYEALDHWELISDQ